MFRVKICGLTRPQDVREAVRSGADALGFQMSLGPRKIQPDKARALARLAPFEVLKVGVFVGASPAEARRLALFCGFDAVQLHGEEDAQACAAVGLPVIRSVGMRNRATPRRFKSYPIAALLLDRYNPLLRGGTGQSFPWAWARETESLRMPVLLAGGLNPENVAEAVKAARPFGVDTSSGVETAPGVKDAEKIRRFVKNAREALERTVPPTL